MLLVPGPHRERKDLPSYRPHSKPCEDAGLVRTDLCGFLEKLKILLFFFFFESCCFFKHCITQGVVQGSQLVIFNLSNPQLKR